MKNVYTIIVVLACSFFLPVMAQTASSGTINYQTFYNDLSPYETWINYPGVGEVWHPDVGSDFRPYATNGYWENTDQGWYWDSNYDWGWAPFHYGNWFYDSTYGWLWEPGYEWSPAWVTWGDTDNSYAWAPLAPEGITLSDRHVPHDYYWNMVDRKDIYDRNLSSKLANENQIRNEASKITVRNYDNNQHISQRRNNEPSVSEVAKYTNQNIPTRTIHEVNQPVKIQNNYSTNRDMTNNRINAYKPAVQTMQPTESRKVESTYRNIMQDNNRWPTTNHQTQTENVRNLPVRENTGVRTTPTIHQTNIYENRTIRESGNHR